MPKSPEVMAIIAKLHKAKGGDDAAEEKDEGEGGDESAMSEAKRAAAEDLFKAIRGREPNEEEAKSTEEALSTYMEACGY